MKILLVFISILLTGLSYSQKIESLTIQDVKSMDLITVTVLPMGGQSKLMLKEPGDVLLEFRVSDFPLGDLDSVVVTAGEEKAVFNEFSLFVVRNIEKEVDLSVTMYKDGKPLAFHGTDSESITAKVEVHPEPLVTNDAVVFGILAIVLALIFYTASSGNSRLKKFYAVIPALLLCYLIPGLLSTFGVISSEYSGLWTTAKTYMLPAALVLMTISIDFKGILNLGPKALIMFGTATVGIILGGPIAIWVYSWINPEVVGGVGSEATWRGMSTLAGSWIGGGANQMAMLELYEYKQSMMSKMIVVDIIVAQLWMVFLLWGAARSHVFDKWLKADNSAIDDLKIRMESYEAENSRKATLSDYIIILGLTFGLVGVAHLLSNEIAPICKDIFGETSSLSSSFFWLIILCTIGSLIYATTRIRKYEGAGASRIGSVFIYILVAIIGMKMDIGKAFEEPELILVGIIWMAFHAGLLFLVAKLIRAPFFFLAVGSKANVGGAASAPVVAAAFHPSLASVGVLLAVLGYLVGSVGAIACAEMMSVVAP